MQTPPPGEKKPYYQVPLRFQKPIELDSLGVQAGNKGKRGKDAELEAGTEHGMRSVEHGEMHFLFDVS